MLASKTYFKKKKLGKFLILYLFSYLFALASYMILETAFPLAL
jgi:hypothetical protein